MQKLGIDRTSSAKPVRKVAGGWGFIPHSLMLGALLAAVASGGGCSKRGEAKITGSSSAPPVSLQCFWLPGNTYRLHLEMTQITDLERPEPNESSQHFVGYDQDYLIKVTEGNRAGTVNLDMQILALGMERANAGKKALSFDSEQGGETMDELGYIPVLKRLIGGHVRFQVSSNGTVLRVEGVSEWLERAMRSTNVSAMTSVMLEDPLDPGINPPPAVRVIRQGGRTITTSSSSSSSSGVGGKVGSTLRSFFSQDHFKQMVELPFLPPTPVRIGDVWSARGDTPISTRGRFRYEASCKFEGWQMHSGTNCARIGVEGTLGGSNLPPGAKPPAKPKNLHATVWVNTELQFPATLVIDKSTWAPPDSSTRLAGTNRVTSTQPQKVIQQRVATTLLWAGPSTNLPPAGDPLGK